MESYFAAQKEKGNKASSLKTTEFRLVRFFGDTSRPLRVVTAAKCASLYEALRKPAPRFDRQNSQKSLAVDTHRNTLAEVKTFLNWCVEKGWLTSNPALGIDGVGKRQKGKEQLRLDESRRWLRTALELAELGEAGPVAASCALLLALRATEITSRVARDVDDSGALLWIPDSKTPAGRRRLEVPEVLRPYLLKLTSGKKPGDLLFGRHDRGWVRRWVHKICAAAKVPIVCAHSMRGLHATLATESGSTGHAVARTLGHESFGATTRENYIQRGAVENARQRRALEVIVGGKG